MTIEEAIGRLEDCLRRLKVQYDLFFAGSLKKQPFDLKREAEGIINSFANTSIRSYAQRYQFSSLVSRYNAYNMHWIKQLRAREEGRGPLPRERAQIPAPPTQQFDVAERECFKVRISDPQADQESMRQLYESYLQARRSGAENLPGLKLESFVRQVTKQAAELKQSSGCSTIEFRVLVNGDSVSLKARAAAEEVKA